MLIQNDSFAHYCALLITSPSFFVFAITVKQSDFKITLCEDGNGDRPKCEILIQAVVLAHYCMLLVLASFLCIPKLPFLLDLQATRRLMQSNVQVKGPYEF